MIFATRSWYYKIMSSGAASDSESFKIAPTYPEHILYSLPALHIWQMLQFYHKNILLFPKPHTVDMDLDDIINYRNGCTQIDFVSMVGHKSVVLRRIPILGSLLVHKSSNIWSNQNKYVVFRMTFTCAEWIFQYFGNKDISNLLLYFFLRPFLTTLWRTSNAINYNNFYNSKYNVVVESFPYKCNIQEYFCEFYQVGQLDDQHFSKNLIVLKWASIRKRPNHLFHHSYFQEGLVFHGELHLYWKSLFDSFCEAVDIISLCVKGMDILIHLNQSLLLVYRGNKALTCDKKVDQIIYPLVLWTMNL